MAYPNYFPQYYTTYPQMTMPIYQPQVQTQPTKNEQTQPQIQNGGFVPVPSEDVARNYPVANGVSVTFKNENAPYVYTKTKGFSQLDVPVFEKYRLVKEEDIAESVSEPISEPKNDSTVNDTLESIKAEIEQIKGDIEDIQKQIDVLKDVPKKTNTTAKKRDDGDA